MMTTVKARLLAGCLGVGLYWGGLRASARAPAEPDFLWGEGRPFYLVTSDMASGATAAEVPAAASVPVWSGSFRFGLRTFRYTMVGTDPALGSATTTVPVVIIPLNLTFMMPTTALSASDPVCGDSESATTLALDSPLFQPYTFLPGGTDVGTTQYIDAFQRANFWSQVSTVAPDYHVLLSPTVAPTQTIAVPRFYGSTQEGPCARIGRVSFFYFDSQIRAIIARLGIPSTSLPLFVTYNTFLTQFGRCCVLGYHSAMAGGQTYAFASYSDPGIFSVPDRKSVV